MANVMDEMNAVAGDDDEESRHILGAAAEEDVPEARDAGSVKKSKSSNLALYVGGGLIGLLILGKGYLMFFSKPSAPPAQNQFQALNVQPQPAPMEAMPVAGGMPDPALQPGAPVDPNAIPGVPVDPLAGNAPDPLQPQSIPPVPTGAQPVMAATALATVPQGQGVPGSPSTPVSGQAPMTSQAPVATAPAPVPQVATPVSAAPVQAQVTSAQNPETAPTKVAPKKVVKKRASTKVASAKQDICAVPDEYEPLSKEACDALKSTRKPTKASAKPVGSDDEADNAYESGSKHWIVRMVVPGRAQLVSGSGEVLSVAIADAIPGAGKVTAIDAEEGVVKTSSGARFGFKTL